MTHKIFNFLKVFIAASYYLLVALPLVVSAAPGTPVTVEWDELSSAPDGYNLYQRIEGESYDYSNPVNESSITDTSYTVENIQTGVRYYFVVSALAGDDESEDSNEIEYMEMAAEEENDGDENNGSIASISSTDASSTDSVSSGCFLDTTQQHNRFAASNAANCMMIIAGFLAMAVLIHNSRLAKPRNH